MVQVFQASQLTLHDVKAKFGLQESDVPTFFTEWQGQSPQLTEYEGNDLHEVVAVLRALGSE